MAYFTGDTGTRFGEGWVIQFQVRGMSTTGPEGSKFQIYFTYNGGYFKKRIQNWDTMQWTEWADF